MIFKTCLLLGCSIQRQNASALNFRTSRYYFSLAFAFWWTRFPLSQINRSYMTLGSNDCIEKKDNPLAKNLFWVLIVKRELDSSRSMNKFQLYLSLLKKKKMQGKDHCWNNAIGICTKILQENTLHKKKNLSIISVK